jgi:hypothetical protein
MKWEFETYQRHREPETFTEFLRMTVIEATRDFYRPLFWAKSFFTWMKTQIIRLWNGRHAKH